MSIVGEYSTRNKLIYSTLKNKRVEYLKKAPGVGFDDLPEGYKETKIFYVCPMGYEVEPHTTRELKETFKS